MTAAPGPYDWSASFTGHGAGFHAYLTDAAGRRIGVVWGPAAQKVHTAALLAAAFQMREALKQALDKGFAAAPEILAALAAAEYVPPTDPEPAAQSLPDLAAEAVA